ncbi:glycosyltransferase [Nocardioides lacusdianchii]|uniref:glycosyltransferase n=1 Tax=Nocardioides lacusdianchii TaxID=2783664 RepID=UPI001CCC4B76|nr:glycosyltransferase [Nocardioides lacusdianchii]
MARIKVVQLASTLGYDEVPHAGGRYLSQWTRTVESDADLTVFVPGTRTNREAALQPGAPQCVVPLGLTPAMTRRQAAMNRLSLNLDTWLRRFDPGMPYLPLVAELLTSRSARDALRSADVIDLQWADSIRLLRLVQSINSRAFVSGTFHDVLSQSLSRRPVSGRSSAVRRRFLTWQARRHERRMVDRLDEVVVFSDKDAALLDHPPHARVIRPPLGLGAPVEHRPGEQETVLVVSYLSRPENDEAAQWVLTHVWPDVVVDHPQARLRLVGKGASEVLRERSAGYPSVEIAGYVEDLPAEYRRATVVLVPVMRGAGVKFKTVEALLHGVPVVTTSVGAEGVGGAELFVRCTDSAAGMGAAISDVLRSPSDHQERADRAQQWAWSLYSVDTFDADLRKAWPS